jgi:hypothetical protein
MRRRTGATSRAQRATVIALSNRGSGPWRASASIRLASADARWNASAPGICSVSVSTAQPRPISSSTIRSHARWKVRSELVAGGVKPIERGARDRLDGGGILGRAGETPARERGLEARRHESRGHRAEYATHPCGQMPRHERRAVTPCATKRSLTSRPR